MTVSVEIEGVQQAVRRLDEFADSAVTRDVHKTAADVVLDEADRTAPERSARLRRTGRTSGTKRAGVVRYGNARVPYARNVHFGDLNRPQGGFVLPNPWLYDAADARADEVREAFQRRVNQLTRRF